MNYGFECPFVVPAEGRQVLAPDRYSCGMPDLIAPTERLHDAWLTAHTEWGAGVHEDGFGLLPTDEVNSEGGFAAWVARLATDSARCTYRWIIEGDQVLGGIALRHESNDIVQWAGHIGYGIRPFARGRGLAAWALARMVDEARVLGMDRLLVVCEAGNGASAKTIERQGGIIEDACESEDSAAWRYWIRISDPSTTSPESFSSHSKKSEHAPTKQRQDTTTNRPAYAGRMRGSKRNEQMINYSAFRQAVRRYAPSELIPFASAHAARHLDPFNGETPEQWKRGYAPWFYSALARESIVYGNEYRSRTVSDDDMVELRNLFMNTPVGIENSVGERILARFVQGISYEQFPFQTNVKQELARSYLLFAGDLDDGGRPSFPRPNDWVPVLGGTITEALSASFVFAIGAHRNNGIVDPAWLDTIWAEDLEAVLPRSVAAGVLDCLSSTVELAKKDTQAVIRGPFAYPKYAYNPLVRTPIVDFGPGPRFAPQPYFIQTAMTAENLYYRGIQVWDPNQFGKAVGLRVQDYVGRQLRHTGQLDVRPEFRWTRNKVGGIDSSDWFVVTPSATILIECKSARTNPAMRSGTQEGLVVTAAKLKKAFEQINENALQLRAGNPQFNHLPTDRPLIGLVVTAEPLYVANSTEVREMLPNAEIPILTISLRDLETLAVLSPEMLGDALCSLVDRDTETYMLSLGLGDVFPEGFEIPENALLDQAFEDAILPRLRDYQRT